MTTWRAGHGGVRALKAYLCWNGRTTIDINIHLHGADLVLRWHSAGRTLFAARRQAARRMISLKTRSSFATRRARARTRAPLRRAGAPFARFYALLRSSRAWHFSRSSARHCIYVPRVLRHRHSGISISTRAPLTISLSLPPSGRA